MWGGDVHFRDGMDNLVRLPLREPAMFDDTFNPPRRCVAVFGHEQSNKHAAVEQYCREFGMPFISSALSRDGSVHADMSYLLQLLMERFQAGQLGPRPAVVLLQRADRLCFDCDTDEAARNALSLADAAQQFNIIWVCLMDRTPMHPSPSTPLCTARHQIHFLEQFMDAALYFPPPDSSWMRDYLRERMESFARFYAERVQPALNRPLRIELTDADYTVLADATRGAAVGHVDAYLRAVWHALCSEHWPLGPDGVADASFFCGPPFVVSSQGVQHMVRGLKALRDGEAHFEEYCGGARQAEKQPAKRVRTESEAFV